MNECKRVRELFLDLCDDLIDVDTKASCHQHMKQCRHCEEEFRWYGLTVQALTTFEPQTPPPDFVAQVRNRLDAARSPSFMEILRRFLPSPPSLPLPVGVAALSLIVVLSFTLYNETPTMMTAPYAGEASLVKVKPVREGIGAGSPNAERMLTGDMARSEIPDSSGSIALPQPSTKPTLLSTAHPKSLTAFSTPSNMLIAPTIADKIGADNLTVESPRIQEAVESLKRILPHIHGRLVQENTNSGLNEVILRIAIPAKAYGKLATELINHGPVEAGAGSEVKPPKRLKEQSDNVELHVRFVQSR